jgi:hypothetical protein
MESFIKIFEPIKGMENSVFSGLKEGFSELKPLEISGKTFQEDFGEIGKEKIIALKKAVKEINQLIVEREKLSSEIFEEGEKLKVEINNFILENKSTIEPHFGDSMREKTDLRHKKMEISELQLNEKIECWKDIALLKKELRIYEKELIEKEGRLKILDEIMNQN